MRTGPATPGEDKRDPIDAAMLRRLGAALERHRADYLVIGRMGAILHGYPDTTQDVDLFVHRAEGNAARIIDALEETGFDLGDGLAEQIRDGAAFIQITRGPFDIDLVHEPDGMGTFDQARRRAVRREDLAVASLEDITASKRRCGRAKDREALRRLGEFTRYLQREPAEAQRPRDSDDRARPRQGAASEGAAAKRPRKAILTRIATTGGRLAIVAVLLAGMGVAAALALTASLVGAIAGTVAGLAQVAAHTTRRAWRRATRRSRIGNDQPPGGGETAERPWRRRGGRNRSSSST